jgi:molybdenum cofactor guanylyltransferase
MGKTTVAVVLAGGQSRRFGANKALADLGGQPMIVRVARRLLAEADGLAVAGGSYAAAALNCTLLKDPPLPVKGPLLGILAGLDWAREQGASWLVTAPCDTPLLPLTLVSRLTGAAEANHRDMAIAETPAGLEPLCAAWSPALAEPLRLSLAAGVHPAIHAFARERRAVHVLFEEASAFLNANTPADYARLLQLATD